MVGPDLSGSYNISITGSGSTDETQTVIEESVTSGSEDYGEVNETICTIFSDSKGLII